MIDMILWENYRKVCFFAPFEPSSWPAYAIVTAWNPASRWVGMRRNSRRHLALLRLIDDAPDLLVMGPVWGSSLDESWQEASLLLQMPRADAVRLASRFGQNACYWVEGGALWLIPVLMKGEPHHLGRLTSCWIVRDPT
ncbi:DUF3293 domain-containing protein [Aeromonas sp. sif2433]|uniref:DUF3293 domain-containing protein n=1 Tax=Aeromonas sp. sif2433 TaxID=2854794 RepID=UPI001C46B1F1|nr:DUF3293 domain-containing protein [Aeromonas sp. sif2433]